MGDSVTALALIGVYAGLNCRTNELHNYRDTELEKVSILSSATELYRQINSNRSADDIVVCSDYRFGLDLNS